MSSNSANMTLEEKLVQRIKTTELAALIDDEDAMGDLVERAIREALFQPLKRTSGGWNGSTTEEPSLVVAAAKEAAREHIKAKVAERVSALMSEPEVAKAINAALINAMPLAILEGARRLAYLGGMYGSDNAQMRLKDAGIIPNDAPTFRWLSDAIGPL